MRRDACGWIGATCPRRAATGRFRWGRAAGTARSRVSQRVPVRGQVSGGRVLAADSGCERHGPHCAETLPVRSQLSAKTCDAKPGRRREGNSRQRACRTSRQGRRARCGRGPLSGASGGRAQGGAAQPGPAGGAFLDVCALAVTGPGCHGGHRPPASPATKHTGSGPPGARSPARRTAGPVRSPCGPRRSWCSGR